ncbi:MAG: response regulator transcription factor [Burkholderiales bacterium]
MRLLLVEDDRMVGEALRAALRLEGHAVDWVRDLAAARAALAGEPFELILLDRGLPQGGPGPRQADRADGLSLLRELRDRGDDTPVIVLTARDEQLERVGGLDAGADDYLVKPFDLDELAARIRAVARRHAGVGRARLSCGPVSLDPGTRQVSLQGRPVALSAREFAVLEALMRRPGAMLSRSQLEDRLYGWGEAIESNAVSVYVHQLRRKLGAGFIVTVRGLGYAVSADGARGLKGASGPEGAGGPEGA